MILGSDIACRFYTNNKCIKEIEIERIFDNIILQICPNTKVHKTKLDNGYTKGQTDGIFQFLDNSNHLKFWMIQECKRDIGFNSVDTPRAFIQILFYLANFYYDVSLLSLDHFKGIFLDSARYFCYISKETLDPIMEEFEPLYKKYIRVKPSDAHIIPDIIDWALPKFKIIKKYVYNLDSNFIFDEFIIDIFNNKI